MCGIVGILGHGAVAPLVVDALKRLEYRGYDSAGVATLESGVLTRRRAEGKLRNLESRLNAEPLQGAVAIGHTRWATHGRPSEVNAHPHATDRVAVVHNGIIENFRDLRIGLVERGVRFESETDTEVVVQLVTERLRAGRTPVDAVGDVLPLLRGAFALAFLFSGEDDLLIGARNGAPLAIGHGEGENYLGSDALALAPFTGTVTYLEDGDWAILTRNAVEIRDVAGRIVSRSKTQVPPGSLLAEKGNYRHFMAKEIHEQPEVIGRTLAHYIDPGSGTIRIPADLPFDLASLRRLSISACGTAYLAGLVGKYWFERYARIPVEIDVASEFRYREAPMEDGNVALFISQSGETADTLASLRYARDQKQHIVSIVNVTTSSIARDSDVVLPTLAGPEIGVASTKAFTCQLAVLACLAIAIGRARGTIDAALEQELVAALMTGPGLVSRVMALEPKIEVVTREIAQAKDVLYLGRGTSFPLALEGALKLKELSYIHAEGYPAGELKHGPIALIDHTMPVIVLAPHDGVFEKTVSNMQEVAARGGRVILIGDERAAEEASIPLDAAIVMPAMHPIVTPIVYALPVQLLAYYTAVFMGKDVDQPRNLAKSVTVE